MDLQQLEEQNTAQKSRLTGPSEFPLNKSQQSAHQIMCNNMLAKQRSFMSVICETYLERVKIRGALGFG